MRFRDLKGFGQRSEEMLPLAGITTVEEFLSADPYEIFRELKGKVPDLSLNALYAMIGAQEDVHWQQVARERKTEILLRLDDMGIAP
ncbi:transcriptional regulator [Hahella sp. CCB-MM4]|nr:transcriptional regulator [Hahella sp. CCB-MM4]